MNAFSPHPVIRVVTGKVRAIYQGVLEPAARTAGQPVEVQEPELPPLLQWSVPLSLAAGFWLAWSL